MEKNEFSLSQASLAALTELYRAAKRVAATHDKEGHTRGTVHNGAMSALCGALEHVKEELDW